MHRYLEMVPQETTVVLAAERMGARRIGCVLVESGDPKRGPIGIVTETDLVRKVLAKGVDPAVTVVDRVMSRSPLTIAAECSMLDASHVMEGNQLRHLCVVEGGGDRRGYFSTGFGAIVCGCGERPRHRARRGVPAAWCPDGDIGRYNRQRRVHFCGCCANEREAYRVIADD